MTYGLCNTIAPDTYYISEDGRCFKSKSVSNLVACTGTNCMNNLLDYSGTNKIIYVENNLLSCLDTEETRYLNFLALNFDASDLTTLFQDTAGTIPAKNIGDNIGRWNTTSLTKYSTYAYVDYTRHSAPKLETFTSGTIGLNFYPSVSSYMVWEVKLSRVYNATCIIVFKQTRSENVGHIINSDRSWLSLNENVVEFIYTNNSPYAYKFPINYPIIYIVIGNNTTSITRCYIYANQLMQQISPDLAYSSSLRTWKMATLGGYRADNNFILAEIKLFSKVMPFTELSTECEALRIKWNIP